MKTNRASIGKWEMICLLINMVCPKLFLNYQRETVEIAGTAGWIFTIFSSLLSFFIIYIIISLYKNFQGMDIIDIGEAAAGKIGRIISGLLFTFTLLFIIVVFLRLFAENMKTISLVLSPISFVLLLFLGGMVAAAYFDVNTIAKFHGISMVFFASIFLIILISAVKYYDFYNMFPIFGNGARSILYEGLSGISYFSEFMVVFFIAPYIKNYKTFKTGGLIATGLITFFLTVGSLSYISIFPYPGSLENFLPIYQTARLISYGRFFQRIESVFLFVWALAAYLYLGTGFLIAVKTFSKTFGMKHYKALIPAFAVIVFTLSFIPENLIKTIHLETMFFRRYSFITAFLIPLIFFVTAFFRKHKMVRKKTIPEEETA